MTAPPSEERSRFRLPSPRELVRLWPRIRPHRGPLLIATLCLLASSAIALVFPLVVGHLLDAAFVEGDRRTLDIVALGLLGLFAIQAGLNYVQAYLLSATGERAVAGLREELFERLLAMPPGFFADHRTGELTSRLTTDIGLLQGLLSHQLADFSRQIISLAGGIALLTWIQPRLTLTALGVVPLVVGTAIFFGRRLRRMSAGVQDRVAEATAVAEEAFSQIRTVQSFVQEHTERGRFGDRVAAIVAAAITRAKVRGVFFGAITFSTFAGVVIVLWMGGILVLQEQLSAGTLVAFLLYTVTIAASVGALAGFFSGYQEAVGAARRVFEWLEAVSPIADPPAPLPLPTPRRGTVDLDRVSFRYGEESPWALREVSLAVRPGEVVALVGPSGAGKTTLVSLLTRFWDVTEGSIRIDGVDVRRLRLADLRRMIGIVPQEPALFSGTIRENIAYARPGASDEDVQGAAVAAHAAEFVARLPDGYDTVVGERGVKLSGGQRQRVALARAILKDPTLLILDEATSSLDTESERLIEDALERLLVGRTTIIIAHRLSTVRRADRLVVLQHGRVVEEGTHASLLAEGGLYARLYQSQFREGDRIPAGLADPSTDSEV